MAKKNVKPVYPADLETMLGPVADAVRQLMDGRKIYGVANPYPFGPPVSHIDAANLPLPDDVDAARRLVQMAFLYGVCQGYAKRNQELMDAKSLYDSLASILFRG